MKKSIQDQMEGLSNQDKVAAQADGKVDDERTRWDQEMFSPQFFRVKDGYDLIRVHRSILKEMDKGVPEN